ncbi:MAG: Fe-S-containing hydro-lyase [Treponema sp.]|jgi:fumarate hydratase subunit beta|nr:Fe-S-containing hydro-lyase [Treponema sp.]
MNRIACTLPLPREQAGALVAGDKVSLSGVLYTARDAAHKRFANLLDRGEALPFPIEGACIYYAGPAPAKDGQVIGSAGPTTSGRMDAYTPRLLDLGLRCMIGKGERSEAVIAAMKKTGAVYFAALGGAGALLASRITSVETAAFPDLGTEAVRRLTVRDFPAVVAIDSRGGNLYKLGPERYLKPS